MEENFPTYIRTESKGNASTQGAYCSSKFSSYSLMLRYTSFQANKMLLNELPQHSVSLLEKISQRAYHRGCSLGHYAKKIGRLRYYATKNRPLRHYAGKKTDYVITPPKIGHYVITPKKKPLRHYAVV